VDITAQSAAPAGMPPWEQIGMFITRLGSELGMALPKVRQAVKEGQVVSCKLVFSGGNTSLFVVDIPPPWLARVASIKEAASHNIDTERKVVRMSEELKDLLREVKIRVSQLSSSKCQS
jgi:dynactin 1